MNKTIYSMAIALVLGTTAAFANPGGEGNNTNCNGVGNPNSPCEGNTGGGGNGGTGGNGGNGGQGGQSNSNAQQGQQQQQESNNTNQNTNNSTASSASDSNAAAISGAVGVGLGGSVINNVVLETGSATQSSAPINATSAGGQGGSSVSHGGAGGDSYSGAYSEGSTAGASVGDVTSHSGDSTASASNGGNSTGDVTVEDNSSIMYRTEHDYKVNTAASLFTQVCQNGMSGQGSDFGFSIVNSDAFCDNLQLADVMREAFHWELQYGTVQCADDMSHVWADNQYEDHCVSERAIRYYEKMHYHLEEAMDLVESTEEVAMFDRFTSFMARPIAIIGALIWLL